MKRIINFIRNNIVYITFTLVVTVFLFAITWGASNRTSLYETHIHQQGVVILTEYNESTKKTTVWLDGQTNFKIVGEIELSIGQEYIFVIDGMGYLKNVERIGK